MPKKISEKDKEELISDFLGGETIDNLSQKFNFSKITISRYLKKNIGEDNYKDLIKNIHNRKNTSKLEKIKKEIAKKHDVKLSGEDKLNIGDTFLDESFMEIAPLNYEIDNVPQKDLSSVPISDVDLPNIVYMIVDKNIELEIKYLKDYPEWEFLSSEELNRKTIEIYFDLKVAKRFCNKEQKVIKVPNTNVFKISAPFLVNKGITRIVSSNKLISL